MTMHNRTSELIANGLSVEAAITQAATEIDHPVVSATYTTNPDGSIKCTHTA